MPISLAGKTAIVTGAGRGIGKAVAEVFAREGAKVLVVNRSAEAGLGACAAERFWAPSDTIGSGNE